MTTKVDSRQVDLTTGGIPTSGSGDVTDADLTAALANYTLTSSLGTAAASDASAFATATQGAKADSALQPSAVGASVQAHDEHTAKLNVAQTWGKGQAATPAAMTISSGAVDWDLEASNTHTLTVDGDFTLNLPANMSTRIGQVGTIMVTQDTTGGWAMATVSGIEPLNTDTMFAISAAASGITVLTYIVVSATVLALSGAGVGVEL